MNDMIEMAIDSIRVSLMTPQRIVILREMDAERYLPIWIGVYEAEAIVIALQEVEVSRPLTHDLLKNVFGALKARILRVEINALRDDTYYSNIIVEANGRILNIDARPSDALALAVRANVRIWVTPDVLDVAGIIPEEDIRAEEEKPAPTVPPQEIEVSEEHLSVFEDFLEKLDRDKESGDDQPQG
jgi:bifunctional DNase/RNase